MKDKLLYLSNAIHLSLDLLDEVSSIQQKELIDSLRLFKAGETIENYPSWLENIVQEAQGLPTNPPSIYFKRIVDIIENVSYGATESHHVEKIEMILKELKEKVLTSGHTPI